MKDKKILLCIVLALSCLFISATFSGCKGKEAQNVPTVTLTLTPQSLSLEEGKTAQISAVASDSGTDIRWSSQNEQVASVENGMVSGVSVGSTQIIAAYAGVTARCEVNVTERVIDEPLIVFAEEKCELTVGENKNFTAYVYGMNGSAVKIEQPSVDTVKASVLQETVEDGKIEIGVEALARGKSTVTVVVGAGEEELRANWEVTVKDALDMTFYYPQELYDHFVTEENYDLEQCYLLKVNGKIADSAYLENVEIETDLKVSTEDAVLSDNVFRAKEGGEFEVEFRFTVFGTDTYIFEEQVQVVFEAKAQYGKFGNEISMKENTGWDLYNGATKEQFSENPEGENFNPTEGPVGSSAEDTYGLLKIKSGTTGVANSAYISLDGTETIVRNLDAYKDNDRIEITMYYGWNSVRPEISQTYWDFGVLDKDYNLTGTEGTSDAFKTAHPMPTAQWTVWTVTVGELRELGIQAAKNATLGFRIQPHKDASRDYCFYEVEVIEGIESGEAVYGELSNEVTIKSGNEVYWEMKNKATADDFSPNTETIAGNPEAGPEGSLAEDGYSILKIKTGTTGAANSVYVRLEGTTAIMRNLDSYGENDRVEITMYYGWQTEFTNMNQTYWDFGVLDGNYNLTGTSGTNNAFKNEHPMPTQKWVVWTVTIGELKELGATLSDESAIGFRIQPHKDSSRDICFYSVKVVKA